MIMPRGQQLLLPVNPVFIGASSGSGAGHQHVAPWARALDARCVDGAAGFLGVHQPLRVGMGLAFVFGLCMDVHQLRWLGQHALAYALVLFGTSLTHRRLLWFAPGAGVTDAGPCLWRTCATGADSVRCRGACFRSGDICGAPVPEGWRRGRWPARYC